MADIISRLKLESGEFDSKIKRAGQELLAYSEHCKKTGLQMGYANKDAKEFAKALGNMQTTSTTARGKINELSDAFVNLKVMYKQMTDEEKNNTFGKNLAASLDQLKTRINDAKKDLADVTAELNNMGNGGGGSGGLFSGMGDKMSGMMQVLGGNLMTKGVAMLTSELVGSVQQSIELAKAGEGIRMAFERINKPGLLDKLKEATHGTVSELELMKQAVKFDNFGLSLDQMGTFLAFAQQQAKDTGQSVDYMVDSIVTGLGRKSLPILDNLGLSAADIRERMKETGDMTSAVAQIIQERMDAAGGYVETAADRAARATATAQDKAEEFGRTALPIAQEWAETWATLSQGAMTFANTLLGPVAKSIQSINGILNSDPLDRITGSKYNLFNGYQNQGKNLSLPNQRVQAPGGYVVVTDAKTGNVLHEGHYDSDAQKQSMMASWNTTTTTGSRTRKPSFMEQQQDALAKAMRYIGTESFMKDMRGGAPAQMMSPFQMLQAQHQKELSGIRLDSRSDFEEGRQRVKGEIEERNKKRDSPMESSKKLLNGISQLTSGLEQIGIDIPDEVQSVISVIQGVMQVIEAVQTIIGVTQTTALTANTVAMTSLTAALWANTASGFIPFANGGVVHAAGGIVAGNTYSGDQIPAMLNAGEVVLNRAQASTLASQLQGGGMSGLRLETSISMERLRIGLNTNGRRTGRGEFVTTNRR